MQAKITGQYLKNFVDKVIPDKVIIETAPFVKSMTTAAQIAKTLDYHYINMNYLFTPRQSDQTFDQNPIPDALEYTLKGQE
jgi:hypothetical protein